MIKINKKFINKLAKALYLLLELFYHDYPSFKTYVAVKCIEFYDDYHPENGDEVATYRYKFHITVGDKLYIYEGWCYENDILKVPLGIYSHWLLSNYEICNNLNTPCYNMYTCIGNLVKKETE